MSPITADSSLLERDVVEVMVGFARALRVAGVRADGERVHRLLEALAQLDVADAQDVYWAGRVTLCADPDDLELYDAAFALYFTGYRGTVNPFPSAAPPVRTDGARGQSIASDDPGGEEISPEVTQASAREVLRHKDISALTAAERRELQRLFALLAPRLSTRRSRRHRPSSTGPIDLGRSVRRMLRAGGEPGALAHRRRRLVTRRLVLLIDVSGSMSPYADALLRFAHAAVRSSPTRTEVFTLGTRMTRVTRALRLRDADHALTAAGQLVPDWSGGTRLGDTLKAFLDRWGRHGLARGAVVVICSDGWERGDASMLGEQLGWLARLSHAIVWVNPHKGKDGFAPLTAGMQAALPHLDELVAGHTFAALEELARVISRV